MVEELEQIPKRPLLALVPFRRFHDLGESLVINIRAVDRRFNVDRDFGQPIVERRQDWENT